jgi:uncharacterized protein (TIGR02145 family)
MHISFILFIIIVIAIVAISSYFLGKRVCNAAQHESPEAKNTFSPSECLAKNTEKFKYGTFTDARDGETYRTVKIGDQEWMVDNLRFKPAGEGIYAPNNEESNVKTFGRLYTWTTMLDIPSEFTEQTPARDLEMYHKMREKNYQGLAPEGWHIPSTKEWETLLSNLDEKTDGSELRSACFWHKPGKDSFGFFALPAGYRFDNGTFCHFGRRARFWSKDEYGKANAYRLNITDNSVDIEGVYRSDALSVRCVKNA